MANKNSNKIGMAGGYMHFDKPQAPVEVPPPQWPIGEGKLPKGKSTVQRLNGMAERMFGSKK